MHAYNNNIVLQKLFCGRCKAAYDVIQAVGIES